jgi:hypothetical protein
MTMSAVRVKYQQTITQKSVMRTEYGQKEAAEKFLYHNKQLMFTLSVHAL